MDFATVNLRYANERQKEWCTVLLMTHFNIDKIENIIKHFEETGHNNFKVKDYETQVFQKFSIIF